MKRVIKYISSLLVVILFVTGCAQNGGKSKVTKGCYVEKEIEFPNAEEQLGMNKSYNGKFLCATYNENEKNITVYNFMLSPRNIGDIGEVDAILDAREEKGDVVPLEVDGQIVYTVSGIMGINSNSKHQDIVKEIIQTALGKKVQREINYEGLPLNEGDVKAQESFLKNIVGRTIQDDAGRSVSVDGDAEEIYSKCKDYWKEASLYCNTRDEISVELIKKVIIPSIESGKPASSYLNEFERVVSLKNEE